MPEIHMRYVRYEICLIYSSDNSKICQICLICTNITKKCLRYARDISEIFGNNVKDMSGKCLKYVQDICVIWVDLPETWQKYVFDMYYICLSYFWDMFLVFLWYFWDMLKIIWLFSENCIRYNRYMLWYTCDESELCWRCFLDLPETCQ